MKIIILLRILWTAGAQKIAIREARTLSEMGHHVKLIFLRGTMVKEYEELLDGIDYTVVSETGNSLLSPLYFYITKKFASERGKESRVDYNLIRRFPKFIKLFGADYIICHDQLAGLAGYYTHKKFGVKYSVFIHESVHKNKGLLDRIWSLYEEKVLRNAISVFTITNKVAESINKKYNFIPVTDYPGFDTKDVTSFYEKENAIIADSFWDYGRHPLTYVDMIEKMPGFILYLVGNYRVSGLEELVRNEILKRGLQRKIVMKVGVTESELIKLYQKSKFAMRFGFGEHGVGSIMGPIQSAVPFITNSDLGASELVETYSCGEVVQNLDGGSVYSFVKENNNKTSYDELQTNIIRLSSILTWKEHVTVLIRDVSKGVERMGSRESI